VCLVAGWPNWPHLAQLESARHQTHTLPTQIICSLQLIIAKTGKITTMIIFVRIVYNEWVPRLLKRPGKTIALQPQSAACDTGNPNLMAPQ